MSMSLQRDETDFWHPTPVAARNPAGAAPKDRVVSPGNQHARSLLKELGSRIPAERQVSGSVIEVVPEGEFLTYALGVPLRNMRGPAAAQARVPVRQKESTR
jgi:hypothetical protein